MKVFLNGEILPLADAKISPLDRGFLFGDGIYELIPVFGGHLLRLEAHLQRLARSLAEIRLPNPYSNIEWQKVFTDLLAQADEGDYALYLQVTRGVAPRDHAFPGKVSPTVFAMINPLKPVSAELLADGAAAITQDDYRWGRCDIKAISLLGNVLLRQQASEESAVEAILLRDGMLTEGAASNVFIVEQGVVLTPPQTPDLLPGITRDLVIELLQANGFKYLEEPISEARLLAADEIWLSSSMKDILPVTYLNGREVGEGKPGKVWARAYVVFQEYKSALRAGAAA